VFAVSHFSSGQVSRFPLALEVIRVTYRGRRRGIEYDWPHSVRCTAKVDHSSDADLRPGPQSASDAVWSFLGVTVIRTRAIFSF
jgi:hypothetical protein